MGYPGLLLAAGKGKRIQNFTDRPKALVPVGGQTLIEHSLDMMVKAGIERVVVVIGHRGEEVVEYLAGTRFARNVTYVTQTEQLGTAHAVCIAQEALGGRGFVLCYCDNFTGYDLGKLVRAHQTGGNVVTLALFRAQDPTRHGIMELRAGRVVNIEERPEHPKSDLAFAGMGVFELEIYDASRKVKMSKKGEYYLTDAVMDLIRADRPVGYAQVDTFRVNINTPEDLAAAKAYLDRIPDQP